MKKVLTFLFLLLLTKTRSQCDWQPLGPSDKNQVSNGEVKYTSIAIDKKNQIYVAYSDSINDYKITVKRFTGYTWETIGNPGFSSSRADYVTIALDGIGTPYVAFQDYGNLKKATVMKFNGSNWAPLEKAGFTLGEADYISIAIDNNNIPYIAFRDFNNSKKATVMKFTANLWSPVGSYGFSASYVNSTSIKIDAAGTPYVVYSDGFYGSRATVMKYNGNTWTLVGTAGFSPGVASYTAIVLNKSGLPYVIFKDGPYSAYVMKFSGNTWNMTGPDLGSDFYSPSIAIDSNENIYVSYHESNNGIIQVCKIQGTSLTYLSGNITYRSIKTFNGMYTSITLDTAGMPVVVYKDFHNERRATVKKYNGYSMELVASGFSAGKTKYTCIAIDNKNTPFVAYKDLANGGKATVMKFDNYIWSAVGKPGFSSGAIDYITIELDSNGVPYVAIVEITNSHKASVMKFNGNTWEYVGPPEFTPTKAEYASLAFDRTTNTPYLFYSDYTSSSNYSLEDNIQKYNGTTWQNIGAKQGSSFITQPTIKIDNTGVPIIVYTDGWDGLYANKFNGTYWSPLNATSPFSAFLGGVSMDIDNIGTPYVVGDNTPIMARFKNNIWEKLGAKIFNGGNASYKSISLDDNNTPYVVFQDGDNYNKATVIKLQGGLLKNVGNEAISLTEAMYNAIAIDKKGRPIFVCSEPGAFAYIYTKVFLSVSNTQNNIVITSNVIGGTYKWINCGNDSIILGQNKQSFIPTSNGSYACIVNKGGCVDTSDCIQINNLNIGESDINNNVKIYPNPTSGLLSIALSKQQKEINCFIKNINGQLIEQKKGNNSSVINIDINQPTGIYFIKIYTEEGLLAVKKIIKK